MQVSTIMHRQFVIYYSVSAWLAMQTAELYVVIVNPSARLSVWLSHAGTASKQLERRSRSSPWLLVSSWLTSPRNSKGYTASGGAEWERARIIRNFHQPISRRISETVQVMTKVRLWRTNKICISHMRFRLVPKSLTLDDLERTICTLLQRRCVFWSPQQKFEWRQTHIISGKNVGQRLQFLVY